MKAKASIIKIVLFILSSLATLGLSGCKDYYDDEYEENPCKQNANSYLVRGTIDFYDKYGSAHPSFTVADLKCAGFEYGDLVNVVIGGIIYLEDVPFTTGINEVGAFNVSLCDYNAMGTNLSLSQLSANFKDYTGGEEGDSLIIVLSKKGGYSEMYKIMHSVYNASRPGYGTDEQFANFREVKTTGIADGVLYRSSNPLNPVDNSVRYSYADKLAKKAGVKTEIDLADSEDKINQLLKTNDLSSSYCSDLFENDNVVALDLDGAFFSRSFMEKLKPGFQFMINNSAPYLIHCNEGKDRCGFVSLLLEALAGASYQEIVDDYMTTFCNFYHVKPGSRGYNVRKCLSVDRFIWMLGNYNNVENINEVDWDNTNPYTVDLQRAAYDYLIDCGLSDMECHDLVERLAGR